MAAKNPSIISATLSALKSLTNMRTILLATVLLPSLAFAQMPADKPDHKFWTRSMKLSTIAAVGLRSADAAQSCYHYSQGYREVGLPGQGCSTIVAWSAGTSLAGVGASWLLHKAGWHRFETLPNWTNATIASSAIVSSYSHGTPPHISRPILPVPSACGNWQAFCAH